MLGVLLPVTEDFWELARRELITNDLILRTEYHSRRRPVVVFEVHTQVLGEPLAAVQPSFMCDLRQSKRYMEF